MVSGATGGVGSIATVLLSELGYKVAAITGKPEAGGPLLTELGASSIVPRSQFENDPKPLAKEIFAGAVDTVGGVILTNIITMIKHSGTVAACGLAGIVLFFFSLKLSHEYIIQFLPKKVAWI